MMNTLRTDIRLTSIVVISTLLIISVIVSAVGKNSVQINGYSTVLYCAIIFLLKTKKQDIIFLVCGH